MPVTAKDRLIIALAAQLRAERETRGALAELVGSGQLDPQVLHAILTDPVPVITQDDVAHAERLATGSARLAGARSVREKETH